MIRQSLKMAWKTISTNKMRSFLTMLGIVIGVFTLVVLVSMVIGATSSIMTSISGIETNRLTVYVLDDKDNPLKMKDVEALMDEDEIGSAAPVSQTVVTASASYKEQTVTVYGTTPAYSDIMDLQLYAGRFLKSADLNNHTNTVVINAGFATDILGRMDVVGETIKLSGQSFEIVGVLDSDENDTTSLMTYEAYVPFTSLVRMSEMATMDISTFYVSASEDDLLDVAEELVETRLLERFSHDSNSFLLINQSTIMSVLDSVTNIMGLLLTGISAISLIVGGIGIMNIMLVSVTERTREIGIRKAIGAGRGTIMMQFLIEALVLSLMGCAIGIAASALTLWIIGVVFGYVFTLNTGVVWASIAFAVAIGLIFGLYPANSAAKKKPIDALRYTG